MPPTIFKVRGVGKNLNLQISTFSNNRKISHFKIDVHTPGTIKSKKIALLLVKNKQKCTFFIMYGLFLERETQKKTLKIL